jgi:hypothetical protein
LVEQVIDAPAQHLLTKLAAGIVGHDPTRPRLHKIAPDIADATHNRHFHAAADRLLSRCSSAIFA